MRRWRKRRKRDISGALMLIAFGLVVMLSSVALSSSRLLMFDYGILGFFTGFTLFLVSVISLA